MRRRNGCWRSASILRAAWAIPSRSPERSRRWRRAPAQRRCNRRPDQRAGGGRDLPRGQEPHRRSDRTASSGPHRRVRRERCPGTPILRGLPGHRPEHQAPGDRGRDRADAGPARLRGGRASGSARTVRALALRDAGTRQTSGATRRRCGGSARRIWRVAMPPPRRSKLAGALRAFQSFEMNAEILACLEDHAELMCTNGRSRRGGPVVRSGASHARAPRLMRSPRNESRWEARDMQP